MKAKACTRCRQWKVRCDISDDEPGGCSRCRSLKKPCVFDRTFKRTPRTKRMSQRSSEIQLPQPVVDNPLSTPDSTASIHISQNDRGATSFPLEWASQLSGSPEDGMNMVIQQPSTLQTLPRVDMCLPRTGTSPLFSIGDVTLTPAQTKERFRRYFAWYHQYLPFKMRAHSAEEVYAKSPLLFWTICSATSSWKLQSRLTAPIKDMVKDSLFSPRSIETIQALLILCVWPCPLSSLSEEPSHIYSGLATQMSLQLGLHRPMQAYSHLNDSPDPSIHSTAEVKLTTWMACFLVGQIQASSLGVPPPTTLDPQLLKAFDNPMIDIHLTQLCRIHYLLGQAGLSLRSDSPTPSGLMDATARLDMIKLQAEHFDTLQKQHLNNMSDMVKIMFLTARVKLRSFALLDDMPSSSELLNIVKDAQEDACAVIDLCCHINLSTSPYYVRRAMPYCAFVLVKFLRSPYKMQVEVLQDHLERVCQALTASSPEDINYKASQALQTLPYLEDKKLSPPIVSRMEASVFYDLLRIWVENNFARTKPTEQETQNFDLDGFDWTSFGILPVDMADMNCDYSPC
ncbi:hypothetical protein F5884DRAFT_243948 [Xylogone sp. PMI_703]|nr:hypothetical protein F5884DRAFT_243948 [Xylogone sp. PMI_703]